MKFPAPLQEATLLRRYKRFLADVELATGETITVHCPNTGAMTGCAEPGAAVWLSRSTSKTRKYPHTWELVDTGSGLACVHSALANRVVAEAVAEGSLPELAGYSDYRGEVSYGKGSRADLVLEGEGPRCIIEVKSVTLCREDGVGLFPDAVSERGRKHLRELAAVAREDSTRACIFFCAFHGGIQSVSAAGEIDRAYRDTLAEVRDVGVEVQAWHTGVRPAGLELDRELPFSLDPD